MTQWEPLPQSVKVATGERVYAVVPTSGLERLQQFAAILRQRDDDARMAFPESFKVCDAMRDAPVHLVVALMEDLATADRAFDTQPQNLSAVIASLRQSREYNNLAKRLVTALIDVPLSLRDLYNLKRPHPAYRQDGRRERFASGAGEAPPAVVLSCGGGETSVIFLPALLGRALIFFASTLGLVNSRDVIKSSI